MKYSKEQIDKIQQSLLDNKNPTQVSKELSIPNSTVTYLIKKHKLRVIKRKNRLNINHNYFNLIDSSEKAYILGYFIADGCIEYNKVKRIRFNSAMNDFEIIEFIRNQLSPETKMTITEDKREKLKIKNRIVKNKQKTVSFGVVSSNIVDTLLYTYNIGINKTYSQNEFNFQNVPKKYHRDLIRGFFDGDGSIHGRIDFVSMNHNFLKQIQEIFLNDYDLDFKFKIIEQSNNIGYLNSNNIVGFFNKIYYDNCICLTRKKNKILSYVN
jgi:intein/homing endonuclease